MNRDLFAAVVRQGIEPTAGVYARQAAREALDALLGVDLNYDQRARRLADEAIALVKEHEARCHDGERCPDETVNILAFLAHALGIHISDTSDEAVREFAQRVADYGAIHAEHQL